MGFFSPPMLQHPVFVRSALPTHVEWPPQRVKLMGLAVDCDKTDAPSHLMLCHEETPVGLYGLIKQNLEDT